MIIKIEVLSLDTTLVVFAKVGFFGFDDSTGKFTFIADASNSSEVFSGSAGPVAFGAITGTTCTLTGALDGATIDGGTY